VDSRVIDGADFQAADRLRRRPLAVVSEVEDLAAGPAPVIAGPLRLAEVARLARLAGAAPVAAEAEALVRRVLEGRFHVACVGQFKRGKSSLVNTLVQSEVQPVGVLPVTSAVTVVRYGPGLRRGSSWPRAGVRSLQTPWPSTSPNGAIPTT
jgi:hypothetical protein